MRVVEYVLHNMTKVNEIPDTLLWKVISYKVKTDNMTQHFVRLVYSKLINPAEISLGELKGSGEHFVKVSQEAYEKYHKILDGTSNIPLRSVERLI